MTPGGSFCWSSVNFAGYGIGHGHGVAGRLARDAQQHGVFAVGGDGGVDRHGGRLDGGHVTEAHRRTGRRGLDHKLAQAGKVVHLRAHQAQDQLVIGL